MTRPATGLRGWNNNDQKKSFFFVFFFEKQTKVWNWIPGWFQKNRKCTAWRVMGRNAGTLPSTIQMSQWWTPAGRLREGCLVPPTCTCSYDPGPLEWRPARQPQEEAPEPSRVSSPWPWRGGWPLSVCSPSPCSEVRNGNRDHLVLFQVAELKEQLRARFVAPVACWWWWWWWLGGGKWRRELLNLSSRCFSRTKALKELARRRRRRDTSSANFVITRAPSVVVRHNASTPLQEGFVNVKHDRIPLKLMAVVLFPANFISLISIGKSQFDGWRDKTKVHWGHIWQFHFFTFYCHVSVKYQWIVKTNAYLPTHSCSLPSMWRFLTKHPIYDCAVCNATQLELSEFSSLCILKNCVIVKMINHFMS